KVLTCTTQHEHSSAGHVLAAMIADAFDDRSCAGVTNREALARASGSQQAAGGRAVKSDVAEQNMMRAFASSVALSTQHDLAAAQALADKVIRQAFKHEPHARNCKRAEGLSSDAFEIKLDRHG